jgi:hypothetical protein
MIVYTLSRPLFGLVNMSTVRLREGRVPSPTTQFLPLVLRSPQLLAAKPLLLEKDDEVFTGFVGFQSW